MPTPTNDAHKTLGNKPLGRRDFLSTASASPVAANFCSQSLLAEDIKAANRIPLGLDGHSLRGMKLKATRLIEFAAEQRLDAVLLNNLNYFESLETSHLRKLRDLTKQHSAIDLRPPLLHGFKWSDGFLVPRRWGNDRRHAVSQK